ncbi:MAG: hypothetical protein ABI277_04545 [Burkholderiaceae bacterium]
MKEGSYAMSLNAGGHSGNGEVSLKKHMLIGRDRSYIVSGQIAEVGNTLIGSVLFIPVVNMLIDEQVRGKFLVSVTGIAEQERFTLIGLGPFGLIFEVTCIWQDPLEVAPTLH